MSVELEAKSMTEFRKILRSLENSNVNIPELRELKEQQEYLLRLKDQRQKIETLKHKFDLKDKEIKTLHADNNALRRNLELLDKDYSTLEMKFVDQQNKSKKEEANMMALHYEKERLRTRVAELEAEKEDLKRAFKSKELHFIEIEDESKRRLKEVKEQFQQEKRKILDLHQEQVKELEGHTTNSQELWDMENLIERQNRALKMQEQSMMETTTRNQQLQEQIESMKELYSRSMSSNTQLLDEMQFYKGEAESISRKLRAMEEDEDSKREVEYLKLKMNEIRRGEIQNLENLVSEISG